MLVGSLIGFYIGYINGSSVTSQGGNLSAWIKDSKVEKKVEVVSEESGIVSAVKKVSPAVVSIIVSKDLSKIQNPFGDDPFFRRFFGGEGSGKTEIGGGTGFIISEDGLILTNKHVVEDTEADYTVLMNDGKKYDAKVTDRDPSNDIALIKIEKDNLPVVELGDSGKLEIGQIVIAIGNSLGEYRNTVSTGVVSGLSRSIVTGGQSSGLEEQLRGVIQTDAAINPGNSGGPLVNIKGQVVGINTAIAQGAQNIGFALPINDAKADIKSVKEKGRIVRPMLGVRYIQVNKAIKERMQLKFDYGALIVSGVEGETAVVSGGPAEKAGIVENDIILEVNGTKVTEENPLAYLIQKYGVGDEIKLKIWRKDEEKIIEVTLEEQQR
ncbi:MAG: trypsin-like peptidase domain-containing protein [Actinobacteria bacterium]|nr:trypsin-like peptidase domain-containing protein [Actinomycetota bacterium]